MGSKMVGSLMLVFCNLGGFSLNASVGCMPELDPIALNSLLIKGGVVSSRSSLASMGSDW